MTDNYKVVLMLYVMKSFVKLSISKTIIVILKDNTHLCTALHNQHCQNKIQQTLHYIKAGDNTYLLYCIFNSYTVMMRQLFPFHGYKIY